MDHYKFWMVFAEGGQAPNKQHFVEADAVSEAHRLAKKNGRPAYVLESMMGYEVPEPLVVKFATSEAQPLPPNVLADRPAALHAAGPATEGSDGRALGSAARDSEKGNGDE